MTTLRKYGLPLLVLALLAFVIFDKCKPTVKPCVECTTVTPAFTKTDSGLIVTPPALPDLTGTIMTVTKLADSTLYSVDTIEPGGYRLIPLNVDSVGINIQLEYLAPPIQPAPPGGNSINKYCTTSIDILPIPLGVIVMDIVLQRGPIYPPGGGGNVCTFNCGPNGTMTQITPSGAVYSISITPDDYQPGDIRYILINGLAFVLSFETDGKIHLYECLDAGWTTNFQTSAHDSPVICSDGSNSFVISNERADASSTTPLVIKIDVAGMSSVGGVSVCTPAPH